MYLWKSTNYAARNYLPHDGCGSKSSRTATTMLPKSVVESAKQAQLNTLKSASAHKLPLLLSKLPHGVGGTRVAQHRWKGVSDEDTFWTVTRCKLRGGGHGSVYGRLTWKGLFVCVFSLTLTPTQPRQDSKQTARRAYQRRQQIQLEIHRTALDLVHVPFTISLSSASCTLL